MQDHFAWRDLKKKQETSGNATPSTPSFVQLACNQQIQDHLLPLLSKVQEIHGKQ